VTVSKETLGFAEQPIISGWLSSLPKERTRRWYAYNFLRFLKGIGSTPGELLADIERTPKPVSVKTKTYLASLKSKASARVQMTAVKSFAAFHEAPLPLNGFKLRVPRTRKKPYLSWEAAESIISECKEPYRSVFRFLKWSGLGIDEFLEIQSSPEIQAGIESQRTMNKSYIRIDLQPRKSNLDSFFALVPKQYVPKFPLLTADYGERGRQPIEAIDLEMNWQRARRKAKLDQVGLGPHSLRSCFRSECAKLEVAEAVSEYEMGHGAGDKFGYSREVLDETYVARELSKLWNRIGQQTATTHNLKEQISLLQEQVKELYAKLTVITSATLPDDPEAAGAA
jgi:integrase